MIVPPMMMTRQSAQTGASLSLRLPSSEVCSPSTCHGNVHQGWSTDQNNVAKPNARHTNEIASRSSLTFFSPSTK